MTPVERQKPPPRQTGLPNLGLNSRLAKLQHFLQVGGWRFAISFFILSICALLATYPSNPATRFRTIQGRPRPPSIDLPNLQPPTRSVVQLAPTVTGVQLVPWQIVARDSWNVPEDEFTSSCTSHCDIASLILRDSSLQGCDGRFQTDSSMEGSSSSWMAFVGDSLLRAPFWNSVDEMMPSSWEKSKRAPSDETYHLSHLFCCRNRKDPSTCILERQSLEFKTTLWVQTSEFLSENGSSGEGYCVTWFWGPSPDETMNTAVLEAMGGKVHPDILILNPGLHPALETWSRWRVTTQFKKLFETLNSGLLLQGSNKTILAFNGISSVNEAKIPVHKRKPLMNDVSIEKINHVIEGIIREVEIPISFVPIHRLTKSFRMEVMGDGIHYKAPYPAMVLQIGRHLMKNPSPWQCSS